MTALVYALARQNQSRIMVDRTASAMQPFYDAYAAAVASADPKKITTAGSALLEAERYWKTGRFGVSAEQIYRDCLKLLKENPEIGPFVLSMGRLAYGSQRPNWLPTTYDEQAIMNDISAHSLS